MKICLVSSCGGHLRELRQLAPIYEKHEYHYVVNDRIELDGDLIGRTEFISHAERGLLQLVNLVEAWRILRRLQPQLVISSGASPAVPFGICTRFLGIKMIYIETCAAVSKPTLTGRLVYRMRLADAVFYQWKTLDYYYKNATYAGLLF